MPSLKYVPPVPIVGVEKEGRTLIGIWGYLNRKLLLYGTLSRIDQIPISILFELGRPIIWQSFKLSYHLKKGKEMWRKKYCWNLPISARMHICYDKRPEFILLGWGRMLVPQEPFSGSRSTRLGKIVEQSSTPCCWRSRGHADGICGSIASKQD